SSAVQNGEIISVVRIVGLFTLLLSITSASKDVFDAVLGNTASCRKSCEMTYSLHTYPREDELYACQRGCRLYAICQFVRDTDDLNLTKTECESSCNEAYKQSDEQFARQEQLEAMMPRMHLLYPLTLVRGIWEDMMSQAHSFISSSWTFYLQADDGKIVIFQSEPQIRVYTQIEVENDVENDVKEEPQKSCKSVFKNKNPIYKEYHRTLIQERDRDMSEGGIFSNRNPWLPGWILTSTLVLSVLVLIWICCATVATAVDQYVPAEKLSIYGDNEYLDEKKLIPYPQSSLVIITSKGPEEEEAGPLPSKVNLSGN
uniref:Transmembrane protein 59 n=1 Tax=Neogobius melanostomus TaxID=47308 RepID=A0A8C6US07_9GOBI